MSRSRMVYDVRRAERLTKLPAYVQELKIASLLRGAYISAQIASLSITCTIYRRKDIKNKLDQFVDKLLDSKNEFLCVSIGRVVHPEIGNDRGYNTPEEMGQLALIGKEVIKNG